MNLAQSRKNDSVAVFKGTPIYQIKEVLTLPRNQLVSETEKVKRDYLKKLLDAQYRTLDNRKCPKPSLDALRDQKDEAIETAMGMTFGKGNLPILSVITRIWVDIFHLMEMVVYNEKSGFAKLRPPLITDMVAFSEDPYYVFDVTYPVFSGKSPLDAEKLTKEQNGLPLLNVDEVIALGTHTDMLSQCRLWATGSWYGSGRVPQLWLGYGRPWLSVYSAGFPGMYWGISILQ
ncbi:hypothetical protein MYX07_05550 [Patescibacteria group bacterium AH-259-L07]|nr:hypothetical protein [Patescibacteria group bacterium AH-259-L07]